MKREEGQPLPFGVTTVGRTINFSVAVPEGSVCELLLYKGTNVPEQRIEMKEEMGIGEVRFLAIDGLPDSYTEYNYKVGKKVMVDPYAKAISGTQKWNEKRSEDNHEIRGKICLKEYMWEGDKPLNIPYHQVIAYSLHVRGFSKHSSSKVTHKGTFQGVIEKIPYLTSLGINQIHCMPIYEFEERMSYTNYWGYGPAYFFAPKNAYSSSGDGATELKDMIKACHQSGIEVVLEMPFTAETSKQMMEECLRYYRLEYHVDGFILNQDVAPIDAIKEDPLLKTTKLMKHQIEFQNTMRRFLKGDEGMIDSVIYWFRHCSEKEGIYNYMTNQNGFTLQDMVSYDGKHNEANGENNQDGPNYNYSWNCGAEGTSRKKAVIALRERQIRNAFLLLLLSQGTPCILAGDECYNSQKGNNNVYCQDNLIGWVDWSRQEKNNSLFEYVKSVIAMRKAHPVFFPKEDLKGMDCISCGVPDVSYHGVHAWQVPSEIASRLLGVYYSGVIAGDEECFVAYNMHWLEHSFALPALKKGKKWYQVLSTDEGVFSNPKEVKNQKEVILLERTITVFFGR